METLNLNEALECVKNGKVVYGESIFDVEEADYTFNFFTSSDLFDEIKDTEEFEKYIENSEEYREYENSHTEDEIEDFWNLNAVKQVELLGLDMDNVIQYCIENDEEYYSYDQYSIEQLQKMYNETEGEYYLTTRIYDFCEYAQQNGYGSTETLQDYVGDVIDAIDGLEVGEETVIRKLNTYQCAEHSILSDIYKEILKHKKYLNSKIGTSECEWEYYTEDLDDGEQTMFEKEKFIIKRIK